MARFRLGNSSGNPWTAVSPNKTAGTMSAFEAQFNASVIDQIKAADFDTGRYPWLNPYDFGATGAAGTDQSAAFQAMVDSVATGSGAVVLVPPGIYKIVAPITVTDRIISWQGMGGHAVTEFRVATSFLDINLSGMSAGSDFNPFVFIRDLCIKSQEVSTQATAPTGTAIKFTGEHASLAGSEPSLLVENVVIQSYLPGNGFKVGIDITNAQINTIRNCSITGTFVTTATEEYKNLEHAIVVRDYATHTHIDTVWIDAAEVGIGMVGTSISEDLKVTRCTILQVDYGIKTDTAVGGVQSIIDTHIAGYLYGVKMANNYCTMRGNLIFKRPDAIATQDFIGIEIDGEGNIITANTFLNQSAAAGTDKAILVKSPGSVDSDRNVIFGNIIQPGTSGTWDRTIEFESGTKYNTAFHNVTWTAAPQIVDAGLDNFIDEWGPQIIPSVASTAGLTLPPGHDIVKITGTATITSITITHAGRIVTLIATDSFQITDGSNLKLAGNWTPNADDTLTLKSDRTNWYEVSRSVN